MNKLLWRGNEYSKTIQAKPYYIVGYFVTTKDTNLSSMDTPMPPEEKLLFFYFLLKLKKTKTNSNYRFV